MKRQMYASAEVSKSLMSLMFEHRNRNLRKSFGEEKKMMKREDERSRGNRVNL